MGHNVKIQFCYLVSYICIYIYHPYIYTYMDIYQYGSNVNIKNVNNFLSYMCRVLDGGGGAYIISMLHIMYISGYCGEPWDHSILRLAPFNTTLFSQSN